MTRSIIDNSDRILIVNLGIMPERAGRRYLLVDELPWPDEYLAKRWLHKMPATTAHGKHVVRF